MTEIIKIIIILELIFIFLGCQRASNYLHKTVLPKSSFLQNSERGLQKFRENKYHRSIKSFKKAIDIYRHAENKPIVSLSDIAIMDYYGEGYDKVFLHNYNALNYLMLEDLENANIETKNSNFVQQEEKKKYIRQIRNFYEKKEKYKAILNRYEKLYKQVNEKHNPYQNPFAYYISALLYEEEGLCDEAYIDIKNALNFEPKSKILKDKLKFYAQKRFLCNSQDRRVELFFDIGIGAVKQQVKVPVKIDKEQQKMLYLPTFKLYKSRVDHVNIIDAKRNIIARSSVLCDVDAIKVNAFKAQLPSLIEKMFKESSKDIASSVIAEKSSAVGAAYNAFSVIYSQNNIQTWENLAKHIDVASFIPKKNMQYSLQIIDKNGKIVHEEKLNIKFNSKLKNRYHYYYIK